MAQTEADIASNSQRALEEGRLIYSYWAPKGTHSTFVPIKPADLDSIGGKSKFIEIFVTFYKFIIADPRMNVLFDRSNPDVDVPAEEHGKRLGLWYLQRYGGDHEYTVLRKGNQFDNIFKAHGRAQNCPMRQQSHRGKPFTVDQRDTWLGYQAMACDELKVPSELREKLMGLHAVYSHDKSAISGYGMAFMGPFLQE